MEMKKKIKKSSQMQDEPEFVLKDIHYRIIYILENLEMAMAYRNSPWSEMAQWEFIL